MTEPARIGEVIASRQPPAHNAGGESERARHDAVIWGEECIARITSGFYWVQNEATKAMFPYRCEPHFLPFLKSLYIDRDLAHAILKGRQAHVSTMCFIIGIDLALHRPRTNIIVNNATEELRKEFLQQHAWHIINGTPLLGLMLKKRQIEITMDSVTFNHHETNEGFAQPSKIMALFSGRSLSGSMLHFSEFGYLSAKFPHVAHEARHGTAEGAQHGIKIYESTAKGSGVDNQFHQLCESAKRTEDQRAADIKAGRKPIKERDLFRFWFYPWFSKPTNIANSPLPDEIDPRLREYIASSNDRIRRETGPEHVPNERQWHWFKNKLEAGKHGEWRAMHEDFPTFYEEAFAASSDSFFMAGALHKARQQDRVGNFPPLPGSVRVFWDIGFVYDSAFCAIQREQGGWRILGTESRRGRLENLLHVLDKWDIGDKVTHHHLPHDGHRKPASEEDNILTLRRETMADALRRCGARRIVDHHRAPKGYGIQAALDFMPTCRIDLGRSESLVNALQNIQLETSKDDKVVRSKVKESMHKHVYDAFELAARYCVGGDEGKGGGGQVYAPGLAKQWYGQ